MNRLFFRTACILLALAVILGAMGAHALKDKLNAYQMGIYQTAALYQFLHGLGLIILAIVAGQLHSRGTWAMRLMVVGIILFSGSLYSLSTLHLCGMESIKGILGPITPIGGVCFIAAWLITAFSIKK
ncbi:MAG: DUF423 domain-containing protein [Flavobacteriales bacterium]